MSRSTGKAGPNEVLSTYLAEAGWSPRTFARELNRLLGEAAVSDTAPYYWRDSGGVPGPPIPSVAAYALSCRLGRTITVAELWEGRTRESSAVLPATAAMTGPWTLANTRRIAHDWLLNGLLDRRRFLQASGEALTGAIWAYLASEVATPGELEAVTDQPGDPLIDQIEQSIPMLQRLDDARGGAGALNYVGVQLRAALLVLHEGGRPEPVTKRLLMAIADLAQLAGWMSVDAGREGLAQRYFLTGLRAAHDAGYRSMVAHILADMSFQAASRGDVVDGVDIGEAAERTAAASASSVRAAVLSRLSYAYASAGGRTEFDRARARATEALAASSRARTPEWMYYLTANHLDCQAGYSLIRMGRNQLAEGDGAAGRASLKEGARLLRTGAYHLPSPDPSDRRALFEGAWLALAYTARGKVDDACTVARLIVPRLGQVQSPRSVALLGQLVHDLRRRARNATVADFLPELETALAAHRGRTGGSR
jgi:hypothetical protein